MTAVIERTITPKALNRLTSAAYAGEAKAIKDLRAWILEHRAEAAQLAQRNKVLKFLMHDTELIADA